MGGQHLRRVVDEVHWLHDFAVELGEIEAEDTVVGVGVDAVCLDFLLVCWLERQGVGVMGIPSSSQWCCSGCRWRGCSGRVGTAVGGRRRRWESW